jgi:hypothetical protein
VYSPVGVLALLGDYHAIQASQESKWFKHKLRMTVVAVRIIIDSVGEVSMKRVDEYQLDSIE